MRKCPRLLFQEEQERLEQEEQKPQQQVLHDRQPLADDTTSAGAVNHSDHATTGAAPCMQADDRSDDQDLTSSVTTSSSASTAAGACVLADRRQATRHSQYVILSICPEVGLSKQGFKCADCEEPVTFSSSRICDYDGRYYCFSCHWNDVERTPARLLHNWDASPRPVSRRSLQLITFMKRQPVLFDLLDFNPMLYGLVEDLPLIKVRLLLDYCNLIKLIQQSPPANAREDRLPGGSPQRERERGTGSE